MSHSRPSILLSLATALLIAQGVLAGPNAGFVVSVDEPLRVENPVLSQTVSVVLRATATTEVKGILISAIFDPTVVEFLSYSVGDVTPGAFALPKAPEALENGLSQVDGGSTILGSGLTVIPSGGSAGDLPVPGDRRPSRGWLRNLGDQCRGEHLRRPQG